MEWSADFTTQVIVSGGLGRNDFGQEFTFRLVRDPIDAESPHELPEYGYLAVKHKF